MADNKSFDPNYGAKQNQLAGMGSNPGKNFIVQSKPLKDTLFFNGATALTPQQLFMNGSKDPAYQDGYFPMTAYGRDIRAIAAKTNIQFNGTAVTNPGFFDNFCNNSYISMTVNKNEVFKVWLWQLFTFNISPVIASLPAAAPVDRQDLFLRWNDVKPSITVGAGSDCIVRFVPAAGLTTATAGAGTPTLPNSGLTNSVGYSFTLYLLVDEYQVATGAGS